MIIKPKLFFCLRALLGKLIFLFQKDLPNLRGKQFFLRCLTKFFGSLPLKSQEGIWLETLFTSSMDLSYLDPLGGGHELIREQISSLRLGDIVIDIGANTGYFSLIASQKVGGKGKIFSFEPSSREFIRLLTNINRNSSLNIYPLSIAASNEFGVTNFFIASEYTGINSFHSSDGADACQNVILMPLSMLLLNLNFDEISLIKIDVEGHELNVLKGLGEILALGIVLKVIVEINEAFQAISSGNAIEIYKLMHGFGFKARFGLQNIQHYDEIFYLPIKN